MKRSFSTLLIEGERIVVQARLIRYLSLQNAAPNPLALSACRLTSLPAAALTTLLSFLDPLSLQHVMRLLFELHAISPHKIFRLYHPPQQSLLQTLSAALSAREALREQCESDKLARISATLLDANFPARVSATAGKLATVRLLLQSPFYNLFAFLQLESDKISSLEQ